MGSSQNLSWRFYRTGQQYRFMLVFLGVGLGCIVCFALETVDPGSDIFKVGTEPVGDGTLKRCGATYLKPAEQ